MKILTTISIAALAFAVAGTSHAASHREAPFIAEMPKADATDFYTFKSYEPGREDYVTLIANYNPLQDAYGGPNYFSMSRDTLYEIHVDNNADSVEDLTFQFRFTDKLGGANGNGVTLSIGADGAKKDIAVPLKNVGAVNAANENLNFIESYTLTTVKGDRRTGTKHAATNAAGGASTFAKPFDNVGSKTFPDYNAYANGFVHSVKLAGCPAGSDMGKVFVGQRKDSFAVNLGRTFDLINLNPLGSTDIQPSQDDLNDKNVTTLALEVPIACLTGGNTNAIIGTWTTASMPQVRVLDPTPKALSAQVNSGAWTQVSRLGMPLVNEVVIGLPDKNLFNASEPKNDTQFIDYVTNPTLPALIEALFGSNTAPAPTNFPRADLVAAFLTGLTLKNDDGSTNVVVNQNGSVGEMIRLNTSFDATPRATQNSLGVAAGDNAGFPNGRRPGDDVVDAALRVSMGLLCHVSALQLCDPSDAPAGTAALTDGVDQNARQFNNAFPYLTTPIGGS